MQVDECYQLGFIVKPHGLKGEVRIFLDVDYPNEYKDLESVFVEMEGKLIPFFITKITIQGQKAVVKFEEVDNIEEAEVLKSKSMYLPLDQLPELGDQQFYYHEIIGFDVIDLKEGQLGKVDRVYSFPNQDLLSVFYKDKEVLIPINDQIFTSINKRQREINVNLPDGLISLYIE